MTNFFAITTLRTAVSAGLLLGGLSVFSAAGVQAQGAPPPAPPAPAEGYDDAAPPMYDQPGTGDVQPGMPVYSSDACGCNTCECDSGWCNLGEPCTLKGWLCDECSPITIGGWTSIGYHDESTGDLMFNTNPGELSLHQSWLYIEKIANGECGMDWGFRFDVMYGLDGENTQSFGNDPGEWDFMNGFDHGIYHWALPQLYAEVASGNWRVKAGHFFTPAGYEVVQATGNFFYSHAFTHVYNEPFTHTGVLGEYQAGENLKLYGGWTLGWDTGFDQRDEGSNFLGGFAYTLSEGTTLTYITTIGDFGWRGEGYTHHVVLSSELSDNWQAVLAHDYVDTNLPNDEQFSIYGYLFYTVNDCLKYGVRGEWWDADGDAIYEVTAGVNYRPHANVVIRPEYRYQWADDEAAANALGIPTDEGIFGIDAVLTY